ncbi:hypothetical protein [Variovorax sp. Root411]|uniref:hypothetical protein n=1 Tax=Variovorax sp. Root411 TaxID=1736530 RepID=UPI0012F95B8D|nr:hypothetical protein [Variovorax sp. Root411]
MTFFYSVARQEEYRPIACEPSKGFHPQIFMNFYIEAVLILGLAIVVAGLILGVLAIGHDTDEAELQQPAAANRPESPGGESDDRAGAPPGALPALRQAASSSARACAAAKSRSPE